MKSLLQSFILTFLTLTIVTTSSYANDHQGHKLNFNKDLRHRNMTNLITGTKNVVLTFDDGPSSKTTPYLLNVLAKYDIKATFFMLGQNIVKHPKLVQQMASEGHIIGNHTFSHLNLGKVSRWKLKKIIKDEFFKTHQQIILNSGNYNQYFFRAPYGAWQSRAAKIINKTDIGKDYIGPIFWTVGGEIERDSNGNLSNSADWNCWSKKWTVDQCMKGYLKKIEHLQGGVVLMHDLNMKTAKMVEKLIPILIEKGYSFKKLDQIGLTKR